MDIHDLLGRVYGFAVLDIVITFAIPYVLYYMYYNQHPSFWMSLSSIPLMLGSSVIVHLIFGIDTPALRILGFS